MKNKIFCSYIPEEIKNFAINLFEKFVQITRKEYLIFERVIPFSYVWSFFSYYKIGKKDAKEIIKIWESLGLCKIHRFHGIRILKNKHGKERI
ncbi:MAG: hypothetical protein QW409_03170 [Candidatus Aenigmatarchaeota archaeon]